MTRVFLKSGDLTSRPLIPRGNQQIFRSNAPNSWQTERLELTSADTGKEQWYLEFRRGTIKVREISVTTIDKSLWRPNGYTTYPASKQRKQCSVFQYQRYQ